MSPNVLKAAHGIGANDTSAAASLPLEEIPVAAQLSMGPSQSTRGKRLFLQCEDPYTGILSATQGLKHQRSYRDLRGVVAKARPCGHLGAPRACSNLCKATLTGEA
ncbi:hypothetical protein NDU88_008314 [Pleurodeles waltl]|uniref:Uncharacterized protein n=1 Tax=Pleurodeles waltl TaxID=8319 RepID=A0AAV7NZZ3_PLEWA|nr:hypothetical protein NDU88_008314 [Pleurodeles waltl]